MSNELLNLLVEEKVLTQEQSEEVLSISESRGIPIPQTLLETGYAGDRSNLIRVIAGSMGLTYVDVIDIPRDERLSNVMSAQQAKSFPALPLYEESGALVVAIPLELAKSLQAKDDIKRITEYKKVKFVIGSKQDITRVLDTVYRVDERLQQLSSQAVASEAYTVSNPSLTNALPDEIEPTSEVVQFVDLVLSQAVREKASDIHFDPTERKLQIRYRVDGILREVYDAPRIMIPEIVSRIKIMAEMDISQTRISQDGRISHTFEGQKTDLRVATLPSVWGEKVVLRLLDNSQAAMPLSRLGFSEANLGKFLEAAQKPYGMVLVTGPTGSGKSTTLYSALHTITTPEINVLTVEDPVEYRVPGVTQVQVNNRANMSFSNILRTFLRADPDVILVGEIRDLETASTAMQAGLTGHMVFSTLHTNDAASAIPRLADMGVEPFITSSTLQGIVSQRLVRTLCNRCKQPWSPSEAEVRAAHFEGVITGDETFFQPKGCASCRNTGYMGRIAIHEVLTVTDSIARAIIEGAKGIEINDMAVAEGMISMRMDGFEKVGKGLTSFQEILRVTA
jgi:type IV pilus assembly protein PilB